MAGGAGGHLFDEMRAPIGLQKLDFAGWDLTIFAGLALECRNAAPEALRVDSIASKRLHISMSGPAGASRTAQCLLLVEKLI